jgi:hypothetical protein
MTRLVAEVSVATNIAPNDLLDAPEEIFWEIVRVLQQQQAEMERQQHRRR